MSTYDYAKVMSDYANERMSVEMAMGHALQHIGQLYTVNNSATSQQRELQAQVNSLTEAVKTLRDELHHNLYHLRADVDRLINYTQLPPNTQGKQPTSQKN